MVDNPGTISPDAVIADLLERMVADYRTRHVYLVDKDNLVIGQVNLYEIIKAYLQIRRP